MKKKEKEDFENEAMENPIRQNYDYGGNYIDKVKKMQDNKVDDKVTARQYRRLQRLFRIALLIDAPRFMILKGSNTNT